MDHTELIEKCRQLHRDYVELYHERAFCGVTHRGIQVYHTELVQIAPLVSWRIEESVSEQYPYMARYIHDGLEFYAVLREDDYQRILVMVGKEILMADQASVDGARLA